MCPINACPLISHLPQLKDKPNYYNQKKQLPELKKAIVEVKHSGEHLDFSHGGKKYCQISELKVKVGTAQLLLNQKITKIKKVGIYNLLVYKKQKYLDNYVSEKWYILTNLSSIEKVKKVYSQRMGIEAMFKDYKSGGDHLEAAKANQTRLNNLILLIAISYTIN
ncbi:transposase [Okeania sp. SIO2B9]|uniref:transposase n=1 Tax=Okeania sp. SIO2B9 TaxID=2607782 RepID=UPI0035C8964A